MNKSGKSGVSSARPRTLLALLFPRLTLDFSLTSRIPSAVYGFVEVLVIGDGLDDLFTKSNARFISLWDNLKEPTCMSVSFSAKDSFDSFFLGEESYFMRNMDGSSRILNFSCFP